MPPKLPPTIRERIRARAGFLCEYCHTSELWQLVPFTIDHVVPLSLGGTDDLNNLALCCFHCNRRKSNKVSIFLEEVGSEVPLFNPRTMRWSDNFIWGYDLVYLSPLTDIGRATIELLDLNRTRIIQLRYDDLLIDRHPPMDDPF